MFEPQQVTLLLAEIQQQKVLQHFSDSRQGELRDVCLFVGRESDGKAF
jgi:hypothetical protein